MKNITYSVFLFVIAALLTLFLLSCSAPKEVKKEKEDISIPKLIDTININAEKIRTIKASGNLTIELPNNANGGSFKLNLSKPDRINLKINGPFGISVAHAFVTPDTFMFYNAFENVLVKGKTTSKNLQEVLQIQSNYDEILILLSCSPGFQREGKDAKPFEVKKEGAEMVLSFKKEEEIIKYWVNPDILYITKRCTFNDKGKTLREERYENYTKKDNFWLPKSIQVILHREKQSLSLFFSEIEVNSGNLDFSFTVPNDIKVLNWK